MFRQSLLISLFVLTPVFAGGCMAEPTEQEVRPQQSDLEERGPIGKADLYGQCMEMEFDVDFCGGQSLGNCYCDELCELIGDCCSDYQAVCSGPVSCQVMPIDESGNGQTFNVDEGCPVIVHLEGNPSTGYSWEVISTNRTFGYPASVEYSPYEEQMVGGSGIYELVWTTDSVMSLVGTHTVTLGYLRAWEQGVEPLETFTFTVNILAAES